MILGRIMPPPVNPMLKQPLTPHILNINIHPILKKPPRLLNNLPPSSLLHIPHHK